MTVEEFYDWMVEIAGGWLGWSQEHALAADVNYIQQAYEGRKKMLQAIFGGGDGGGAPVPSRAAQPLTAKIFHALFGRG